MIILLVAAIAWWVTGMAGYVFWQTRIEGVRHLSDESMWCGFFLELTGPVTWLLGYIIWREERGQP
jgi:hypothetical protein